MGILSRPLRSLGQALLSPLSFHRILNGEANKSKGCTNAAFTNGFQRNLFVQNNLNGSHLSAITFDDYEVCAIGKMSEVKCFVVLILYCLMK